LFPSHDRQQSNHRQEVKNVKKNTRALTRTRKTKEITYSQEGAKLLKLFADEVDAKNKTYYANKNQRAAADFLIDTYGLENVEQVVRVLPRINEQKLYVAQVTTPHELKENWVKLGNAVKKKKITNALW